MHVDIREESAATLIAYASVPIAFDVTEVLDVEVRQGGSETLSIRKRTLDRPYAKDYDALDGGPMRWTQRFDLANWGLLAAYVGDERVSGAALAFATPGLIMLEERADLAVLWDIRVSPAHRGRDIGSALIAAAASWAAAHPCRQQSVDVSGPVRNCALQGCAKRRWHCSRPGDRIREWNSSIESRTIPP